MDNMQALSPYICRYVISCYDPLWHILTYIFSLNAYTSDDGDFAGSTVEPLDPAFPSGVPLIGV